MKLTLITLTGKLYSSNILRKRKNTLLLDDDIYAVCYSIEPNKINDGKHCHLLVWADTFVTPNSDLFKKHFKKGSDVLRVNSPLGALFYLSKRDSKLLSRLGYASDDSRFDSEDYKQNKVSRRLELKKNSDKVVDFIKDVYKICMVDKVQKKTGLIIIKGQLEHFLIQTKYVSWYDTKIEDVTKVLDYYSIDNPHSLEAKIVLSEHIKDGDLSNTAVRSWLDNDAINRNAKVLQSRLGLSHLGIYLYGKSSTGKTSAVWGFQKPGSQYEAGFYSKDEVYKALRGKYKLSNNYNNQEVLLFDEFNFNKHNGLGRQDFKELLTSAVGYYSFDIKYGSLICSSPLVVFTSNNSLKHNLQITYGLRNSNKKPSPEQFEDFKIHYQAIGRRVLEIDTADMNYRTRLRSGHKLFDLNKAFEILLGPFGYKDKSNLYISLARYLSQFSPQNEINLIKDDVNKFNIKVKQVKDEVKQVKNKVAVVDNKLDAVVDNLGSLNDVFGNEFMKLFAAGIKDEVKLKMSAGLSEEDAIQLVKDNMTKGFQAGVGLASDAIINQSKKQTSFDGYDDEGKYLGGC